MKTYLQILHTVLSQERRHKNLDKDGNDKTSSKLTRKAMDLNDQKPASGPTLRERIQAAGIAQSPLADRGNEEAKVNNCIVAMTCLEQVSDKQSMILEQKFFLANC